MRQVEESHGGHRVARVLEARGVRFLFTLCGGHISPILVACRARGIRVVDVRHEATAVFAAEARHRVGGVPGVAAVTAGPGLTNTITAVKNAQLAQSPLVVLGGAAPSLLQGRGALQDIDQRALMRPHVKKVFSPHRTREIEPALERAFALAQGGVPGPVFVELPADLLYPEALVRRTYGLEEGSRARSWRAALLNRYLDFRLRRMFAPGAGPVWGSRGVAASGSVPPPPSSWALRRAARLLQRARHPLLLLGSQAAADPAGMAGLRKAIEALGLPAYLSGMARGLLGRDHPLLLRHRRRQALREADLVLLAGVPADFRLDYGRDLPRRVPVIAVNRSARELRLNRRPELGVRGDPAAFLRALPCPSGAGAGRWEDWIAARRAEDAAREEEIAARPPAAGEGLDPVRLCRRLDGVVGEDSVLVGDGGDFVATASYLVHPRGPLSWLDPGVFGTLGAGAGFALGAKLARPAAEVWILYGDGALGYSLPEWDTFARHGVPVIGVVGNDGGWQQIARDQVRLLGDEVGTALGRTAYHEAARGLGAEGLLVTSEEEAGPALRQAKALSAQGRPVLVNVHCARGDFRAGSLSL
jgi:acetolactate synthase-1/2/3 large subunit